MRDIIFFGNQKLVQGIKQDVTTITDALEAAGYPVVANITTKEQLRTLPCHPALAQPIAGSAPKPLAVLASFGYVVPQEVLDLFEPTGILNIHPSLLPKYRGSTPIESVILSGDSITGVSIMKLVSEMDAGPIYAQVELPIASDDDKFTLAEKLTTLGAKTLIDVLKNHPAPQPQIDTPTFTKRLDKSMAPLDPTTKSAIELDREVRAFLGFPKSKYNFLSTECTVLKTHVAGNPKTSLDLKCTDNNYLIIDTLQPASRNPMSAAEFLRGYQH